jgi:hypothetical protein
MHRRRAAHPSPPARAQVQFFRKHAHDGTITTCFADYQLFPFAINWARHLRHAGVRGVIVGLFQTAQSSGRRFEPLARELSRWGAATYPVHSSPELQANAQGGRWFHVLPLLHSGLRVVLSDVDVVWLRDPR